MASPHHPIRTTPKMSVPGPRFPWKRVGLLLVLAIVIGALAWIVQFYRTHAMPSVQAAGQPVGLATRTEIEGVVERATARLDVQLSANGEVKQPSLQRLGVTIDTTATVNEAFDARRLADLPGSLALWKVHNTALQVSVDRARLEAYLAEAFPEIYQPPVAPNLTFGATGGQFELVPGTPGQGFDVSTIIQQIQSQATRPGKIVITASDTPVAPSVSETAAIYTQDEANQRLWLKLEFLYDQELIYYPEPPEIAAWMTFVPNVSAGTLDIRYDRQRMETFLRWQVQPSLNRFFGPGANVLDRSEAPLELVNVSALVDDMIYALRTKQSLSKEVEAVEREPTSEVL